MVTQKYINDLAYKIVGCAIEVHKELGPGLLESLYEKCLIHELLLAGCDVKSQQTIPLIYKDMQIECELRIDLLVNDLIVVELKAVETMIPVFQAQLLTYLKLLDKPKGLLINFNCDNVTKQLVPLVTKKFAELPHE